MNRPRIFLSAVSTELRTARQAVAATIRTPLGFDPVTQDDFPTGHGELRQWTSPMNLTSTYANTKPSLHRRHALPR